MYFNFPHDLCTVSHLRIQVLYITLIHQSISHSLGVKQVYFIDRKKLKVLFYIKKKYIYATFTTRIFQNIL